MLAAATTRDSNPNGGKVTFVTDEDLGTNLVTVRIVHLTTRDRVAVGRS